MNIFRKILPALFAALFAIAPGALAKDSPRQKIAFNDGWRFTLGDAPDAGDALAYRTIREQIIANSRGADLVVRPNPQNTAGNTVSFAQPRFDDSGWRALNLPHDWGIEGAFSQSLPGGTGRLPWAGMGWYRKKFTVASSDSGKQFFLDVDGAMAYATFWLNGQLVGGWPYGYSSFRLDLTPLIKFGAENTLAVRLDNPPNSSRWYPGSGLYRNVWLEVVNPVHVAHWGAFVTTQVEGGPPNTEFVTKTPDMDARKLGAPAAAAVNLKVSVQNESQTAANVTVKTEIFPVGADGKPAAAPVASSQPLSLVLVAGATEAGEMSVRVANPKVWNTKTPNLYVAVTIVEQGGVLVDSYETTFGVRTIQYDPNRGFFLNGELTPLYGVCNHHDLGPLGSAVNTRALQRQIELLQEMGGNAIRTAHNPPAPELLDLCDRMGVLVLDEAFDCWRTGKTANDYGRAGLFNDWNEQDMRTMLRRDRNHPSVIMWSMGNEIPDAGGAAGMEIAAKLVAIARAEDPTRPTTIGAHTAQQGTSGFQNNFDVFGYTYRIAQYPIFRQRNPDIPLLGNETASTVSSRGVYVFPTEQGWAQRTGAAESQSSSYDLDKPNWGTTPDESFAALDGTPGLAGEFVWTGFDYIGEPTPFGGGTSPSRSSYFGIIDLAGLKKDRFYIYQARWRPDLPMAHLVPNDWTWPGREGQRTPVHVYTSGDEAELFLNGTSLGRKTKAPGEYRLRWDDAAYRPGELKVVAYKNGRPWAEETLRTAGTAAKLALAPDRAAIAGDGRDLSFVTVSVRDAAGGIVPRINTPVTFSITGPGEIVAVCSGDATSHDPMQNTDTVKTFNSEAVVLVRAKPGQSGPITLNATSPGLAPASVPLTATAPTGP